MRLERFAVSNFKSIWDEVVLDELEDINVLHGPNNVGKSNILDAIALLFRVLPHIPLGAEGPSPVALEGIVGNGPADAGVFNAMSGEPIVLAGSLRMASPAGSGEGQLIDVECKIEPGAALGSISLIRFEERSTGSSQPPEVGAAGTTNVDHLYEFIGGRAPIPVSQRPVHFELVHAERGMAEPDNRGLVPRSVRQELFEAHLSKDAAVRERWDRFCEAMGLIREELRLSALVAIFEDGRGEFGFQWKAGPILSVDQHGTGVQQVAGLLARLMLTKAPIVGIEEPELNLSYDLQTRLLDMFRSMVGDRWRGPHQLFVTSHSPAFDGAESFFDVSMEGHCTRVRRLPRERRFERTVGPMRLEEQMRETFGEAPELASWLTREGLVKLPEHVLDEMGLTHGKQVYFVKRDDGRYEMLTIDDYEEKWGHRS